MKRHTTGLIFLFLFFNILFFGCDSMSVNKSIHIADGSKVRKGAKSVNGNVIIGKDCIIKGDCQSVNGNIKIGSKTEVDDIQSVNGSIYVGKGVLVHGDINSINGSVNTDAGTRVKGDISTINGSLDLEGTHVENDIMTRNGNIYLANKSWLQGSIIIKGKSKENRQKLQIEITENSIVEGDIIVRNSRRRVSLLLADGAEVRGTISDRVKIIEDEEN